MTGTSIRIIRISQSAPFVRMRKMIAYLRGTDELVVESGALECRRDLVAIVRTDKVKVLGKLTQAAHARRQLKRNGLFGVLQHSIHTKRLIPNQVRARA